MSERDTPRGDDEILDELFAIVESRKAELPEDSYTASLFTHEAADLVYHLLVLLSMKDIELDDLRAELRDRHGR